MWSMPVTSAEVNILTRTASAGQMGVYRSTQVVLVSEKTDSRQMRKIQQAFQTDEPICHPKQICSKRIRISSSCTNDLKT